MKLQDTESTSDFIVRTFVVTKVTYRLQWMLYLRGDAQGDDVRSVKQFHFTGWPDHGVPTRASPILAFRRKINSFEETHPGVVVIHCS